MKPAIHALPFSRKKTPVLQPEFFALRESVITS